MANTPTKLVIDCATGEHKEIPLSSEEIAEREAVAAQAELEFQAELEAKEKLESDKASAVSKLTALGLTESEALALVGA